jgi:uncharacterized membrane protein YozB (DUF420 family)
MGLERLPALNALLNASAAVVLAMAYAAIRRQDVQLHRRLMLLALSISTVFLVSYLTYHYHHGSTPFTHTGPVRVLYFSILISHTLLAACVPPLVAVTLSFALRGRFDRHRRWARWTLPVWFYVSVTGVLIYLMLYRWYPPTAG